MDNNTWTAIENLKKIYQAGVEEMEGARKVREKVVEKAYKRRMLWWHIQMVLSLSYQYKQLMQKLRTYR